LVCSILCSWEKSSVFGRSNVCCSPFTSALSVPNFAAVHRLPSSSAPIFAILGQLQLSTVFIFAISHQLQSSSVLIFAVRHSPQLLSAAILAVLHKFNRSDFSCFAPISAIVCSSLCLLHQLQSSSLLVFAFCTRFRLRLV
jgi:hypothetical protein